MNIENAKKILGFEPKVNLEEGLNETWNWYNQNSQQTNKKHNYFK